ncbi:MAG TPA: BamA/TamA family outer membrane protein, partial [Chitinophagaceae bacterium]|nr:BamA/TamA family outer membrane protein [Chitinophagaceae bacterium]
GIQQGDLYNESKFKQADKRLRELPFMELAYPCRMDFSLDKSKWYVYLKNKNANRADVLLGLLPANESRDGKLLFTGDVKLGFQNALGYGENLNLNWQNLQYRSPRYHVSGEWPFVLNTPIGISARFDFYKRDTLFRNTEAELGVLLQNGSGNMMKLYYKGGSNRLLSVSVPTLIYSRRLPENGDVKTRSMGLENTWSHLDYKPNPRRGHRFYLNLQVAFREILKNNTIESTTDPVTEVPFTYLYDSIKLRTQQYLVRVRAEKFIPLHKRMTMAMSYQGGITYSSESFFRNELFQIGGFRLLRGFDEGALFVNQYHVCSVEPRLALGRNSYVFLFTDQAWLQIQTRLNQSRGWYYSAGAGMVFETRAGLLNLAYALGATPDEGMQFRRAKIHFGYAGTF